MSLETDALGFNPRTYIRYDVSEHGADRFDGFQSTYLYKVRLVMTAVWLSVAVFQSTYLYKVRPAWRLRASVPLCFNPRTYIRYDSTMCWRTTSTSAFQSTYLYKVRPAWPSESSTQTVFQSTYLYKVRPNRRNVPPLAGVSIHVPI